MSVDPFVGEIRLFAGTRAPTGWALCDGRELSVSDDSILFALIGTTYGGDGVKRFRVPDLRTRLPVGSGRGPRLTPRSLGEHGGEEGVTLEAAELPAHGHALNAVSDAAQSGEPKGKLPARSTALRPYGAIGPFTHLAGFTVEPTEPALPHENRMPYLGINFLISLGGIFPSS
jgi:microcystin-dependent protein